MNTFSIPATTLLAMIKQVKRAIPSRTTLSVLDSMRFSFEDGMLSVSAQSNEAIICCKEVNGTGKGTFIFETPKLEKALAGRKKSDVRVEMAQGEGKANISFGNTSVVVGRPDCEDYPGEFMPAGEDVQTFSMEKDDMRISVNKMLPAISKDSLRPAMTGIYMESKENALTLVATNGFVLVEREMPVDMTEPVSAIIPEATCKMLKGCMGSHKTGRMSVDVSRGYTRFRFDNGDFETHVETRNIMESYPDYRAVMPSFGDTMCADADAAALVDELKTVLPFAHDNRCLVSFREHEITLESVPRDYANGGNHGASATVNSAIYVSLPAPAVRYRIAYDGKLLDYILSLFDGLVFIESDAADRGTLFKNLVTEPDVRMRALLMPLMTEAARGYELPKPYEMPNTGGTRWVSSAAKIAEITA